MTFDDTPAEHSLTRSALLGCLVLAALLVAGCASQTVARFVCDSQVNGGVLLTIDLVQVNEAEAGQIRQEGPKWFYSALRRQLSLRTRTIAVKGGCTETVDLGKAQKGYDLLVIVAEYQNASVERPEGNLLVRTRKEWQGKTLLIGVRGSYLTLTEAR